MIPKIASHCKTCTLSYWFPGGGSDAPIIRLSKRAQADPDLVAVHPGAHARAHQSIIALAPTTYKIPPLAAPNTPISRSLVASRRHDHEQAAAAVFAFFFIVSDRRSARKSREELANLDQLEGGAASEHGLETEEQRNKFLVLRLYEALKARDHAAVHSLLAPDLEWWFHGPPAHQHMMRVLTGGTSPSPSFRFQPRTVDAFGSTVIAEGTDGEAKAAYWVHAWTVGADGVITQLREYFNTDLTVTRLAAAAASKCVWQSRRPDRKQNSLPGLVLAL